MHYEHHPELRFSIFRIFCILNKVVRDGFVKTIAPASKLSGVIKQSFLLTAFIGFTGCASTFEASGGRQIAPHDNQDFPYNPIVFHLDLSILAYQFYAQSLVWPFDPYYEDQNNWDWDRSKMLDKVRTWTVKTGSAQNGQGHNLANYRGPGVLGGFENNLTHDPIIYRYNQLNPWDNTITRANGAWSESRTPDEISDSVREIYMCSRPQAGLAKAVSIVPIPSIGRTAKANARDVILAFEGETGNKGEPGQVGSQSVLGFALLRHWPGSEKFDVHISFRGSRSGSPARAVMQAFSDGGAKGNPDWITDLGYDLIGEGAVRNLVTSEGKVFRGFAHSLALSSPQIFGCLDYVNTLRPGKSPERIFVTGHSLGGGLAQHFVSTVLMGSHYGPSGTGERMPKGIQIWPWKNIKLVSFAAPRSGNKEWARSLTENHLKSEFFSTLFNPFDKEAMAGNDPAITDRLLRTDMPAGYRVLISRDPITTGRGIEGKHVGKTVYVNKRRELDFARPPDISAHEPLNKRRLLLESLGDDYIPVWDLISDQVLAEKLPDDDPGSETTYRKLKSEYYDYHRRHNIVFDKVTFDRDFELFLSILANKD